MSTLRALSTAFLVCALAFTGAIVLDRNPPLAKASRTAVASLIDGTRDYVIRPAGDLARQASTSVSDMIWGKPQTPTRRLDTAQAPPRPMPPSRPQMAPPPDEMASARPARPPAPPPPVQPAPRAPDLTAVPEAPPAPEDQASVSPTTISPAEFTRVSLRLKQSLTREMYENFALFLYVSKAENGPWAQHMFVFRKDPSGDLSMLYAWPVSTGREQDEIAANGTRQPSYTPRGYYELDPDRMYKIHYSGQWHQPMPHAMFFNWEHDGLQTGLAIHGAVGLEVTQLGTRASAGCIRISPDNAARLFGLIRAEYKGLAPRFAYDRRTATMHNDGLFMHDASGNLQMAQGYKVLVFVEDYGGDNVVAALF
jgi:L,D-transpeptidase catalytic domain